MGKKKNSAGESKPSVTQLVTQWLESNPTATTPQIIEHFAEQGIVVSKANANKIRYSRAGGGSKANKASGNGAKKGRAKKLAHGEKSEVVRRLLTERGKKARPRDIIAAAAELGYKVTYPEISRIRKALFGRKRRRAAMAESNGVARTTKPRTTSGISVEMLLEIRDFVRKVGGREVIEQAFETLELLAN